MILDEGVQGGSDETVEENYFMSMTDMMVGILFVFMIMLAVLALNYRTGQSDSQRARDCVTRLRSRSSQVQGEVARSAADLRQRLKGKIDGLEYAVDQRRRLLDDMRKQLAASNVSVDVDAQNGVLRLTEAAIRFDPNRSDLDTAARDNVAKVAKVLANVVSTYGACHVVGSVCEGRQGPALETIFLEGHTDATGVADLVERDRRNWVLSTERANATYREILADAPSIRDFRNRRGEQIISVSGYSSTRPVTMAEGKDAFARNRRIDLRFVLDADVSVDLVEIMSLESEVDTQMAKSASLVQDDVGSCY